jgi:hypothetical protein
MMMKRASGYILGAGAAFWHSPNWVGKRVWQVENWKRKNNQ